MDRPEGSMIAEIALFNAMEKPLHYLVPSELIPLVREGVRVLVPLGRGDAVGMVLSLIEELPASPKPIRLKPILGVLDESPVMPSELIRLCRWMAGYYFHPLGEVLQAALPAGSTGTPERAWCPTPAGLRTVREGNASELLRLLAQAEKLSMSDIAQAFPNPSATRKALALLEAEGLAASFIQWKTAPAAPKTEKTVRLLARPDDARMKKSDRLRELVRILESSGGSAPLARLRAEAGDPDYWVKKLVKEGLLLLEDTEVARDFDSSQNIPSSTPPEPTGDQAAALDAVIPRIEHPSFSPFLIQGVTGSGKTEVYLRLVRRALDLGKGALVLVPEIALSTQLEAIFRSRFGDELAVVHSGLPAGVRFDRWRDILAGKRRVVLGVRSGIFMPVADPGLIIIDEEHDASFKQDDRLRYHARDAAVMRAKFLGIPVVLGSATPSFQSLEGCRSGRYTRLSLPNRVCDRPQPTMEFVDMRREMAGNRVISHSLQRALEETLQKNRQALLFLNRRGLSTFFLCRICGSVLQCDACSVSLTYHGPKDRLLCHYCGREKPPPELCPVCGRSGLIPHGFGTERVEEEIKRLFPKARTIRLDRDTASDSAEVAVRLDAMRDARADILIGTQMVAKGHDFPNITLVGVINADTSLQIADFRAGETTVQLLLQVAGRAGRGDDPGRVILQSFNPSHYTLVSVLKNDYEGFSEREMESRSMLQYPPYAKLLRFLVTAPDKDEARRGAEALAALCRLIAADMKAGNIHAAVMGPSPAPLVRLKNRFRRHLFIKTWTSREMQEFVEAVLRRIGESPHLRRVAVTVDRDPLTTL